jgi:osmotically-inducible protein OsmY
MHIRPTALLSLAACPAAAAAAAEPLSLPPREYSAIDRDASQQVSDAHLGLEARARMYEGLGVSNLSVLARQGVATIGGTMRTEDDRQRAERLAREELGITNVSNELRIADPLTIALAEQAAATAEREKADVENMVKGRLRADVVPGSGSIEVTADETTSTVTLTGTVRTAAEKVSAGQVALAAFPAGNVRNLLEVRQRL